MHFLEAGGLDQIIQLKGGLPAPTATDGTLSAASASQSGANFRAVAPLQWPTPTSLETPCPDSPAELRYPVGRTLFGV